MADFLTRRAAFTRIAGAATLTVAPVAAIGASPRRAINPDGDLIALDALIFAHQNARQAFDVAIDELAAAKPDPQHRVVGLLGCDYALGNGKDKIADWVERHFAMKAQSVTDLSAICPKFAEETQSALKRERDKALARLDEAFATEDAAKASHRDHGDAEESALLAVCRHRCDSPDEMARKFRYLVMFRDEIYEEEYQDAIFASLLPEGEA